MGFRLYVKSPKTVLAIKFWRFSVLGMGVWGEPGFVVRPSVRPVRQNPSLCQEPSRVAKKNETADGGGGSVSPRPTTRYPNLELGDWSTYAQGPRRQLPNMA